MEEFLKSITCSGTECLCWILVLFNILAVFYLVFCSFWKVTRIVKITGWVFSAGLLCATIGILIAHTCIYTLLTTVFTCMMIMAIFAVVLPQPNANEEEKAERKKIKLGSYVISKTTDERYVFALYDSARRLIVKSKYSYASIDETKQEICVCRNNGMIAAINDKTGAWIQEEQYPTFEMYVSGGKYRFCLKINGEYVIFDSHGFDELRACEKTLEKAKQTLASTDVYLNTEIENKAEYLHFSDEPHEDPLPIVEEMAEIISPIAEETIEENVVEEVAATTVEETIISDGVEETEIAEEGVIGGVAFNRDLKTLWTKYAELSEEQRRYFDAIRNYANGKDGVKCIESKDYLTFKYGKDKVVRLRIRKDTTEAVFMLVASAFKQSFTENELKVKEAATIIRVENDAYLDGVLKTIDMQYDALIEERRIKREEQNAKRRQARRNKTETVEETIE